MVSIITHSKNTGTTHRPFLVKLLCFDSLTLIVSFLVASMVAYLRKYRYRKFQRRRKAGDRTEGPTVGITGMKSVGSNTYP